MIIVVVILKYGKENYNLAKKYQSFEYVKELKDKGIAKKIGFSFHDNSILIKEVLEEYGHGKDLECKREDRGVNLLIIYTDKQIKLK